MKAWLFKIIKKWNVSWQDVVIGIIGGLISVWMYEAFPKFDWSLPRDFGGLAQLAGALAAVFALLTVGSSVMHLVQKIETKINLWVPNAHPSAVADVDYLNGIGDILYWAKNHKFGQGMSGDEFGALSVDERQEYLQYVAMLMSRFDNVLDLPRWASIVDSVDEMESLLRKHSAALSGAAGLPLPLGARLKRVMQRVS